MRSIPFLTVRDSPFGGYECFDASSVRFDHGQSADVGVYLPQRVHEAIAVMFLAAAPLSVLGNKRVLETQKGVNRIRPDVMKRRLRVVVDQLATLKADHNF